MGVAENKKIVNAYFDAVTSGNRKATEDLLADDFFIWFPGSLPISGTHKGKDALFREVFEVVGRYVDPESEMFLEVTHMMGEGPYIVAEWTIRRKTAKGRDYENFFLALFEIKHAKIQSIREYLDTLTAKQVMFV